MTEVSSGVLDDIPLSSSHRPMCTLGGFYEADISEEGAGGGSKAYLYVM